MNILIADDESIIRTGIRRTLEQSMPDCGIHLAASADEAARVLSEHPIDIVLTDILMPGMDGLEFMRLSRRSYPAIKWVVISAHSEFAYAQKAVQLGAKDYLLKPIGKKRLLELVGELAAELAAESSALKEGELLRSSRKYLREAMFQRLASGQDVGQLDVPSLMDRYPSFHLVMVRLEPGLRDAGLEHFVVDNVFSELLERSGDGFVVSYDRHTLIGVAAVEAEEALSGLLASLRGYLGRYLRIPFQIASSGRIGEIGEVPDAVRKLYRTMTAADEPGQAPLRIKGGSDNKAIEVALQYIAAHYREESLSLERIAAVVYLNPVYFSQLFKQKTGQGFKDYLIGLRLEEARQLLRESDLKLGEIAERIGYQDMRHFTQVFRKRFQMTPTEYRQEKKNTAPGISNT
ncbi:response regulator transcription factor [Paenibacillus pasadenensis]|uniref:Two-component response regulator yesN n=1 Tax=Paenibacillus pasadenensis TaxID=217090 RepID=A0A2N5N103_9BACL|nr:response regulator [Paenibacillus pasadenensis]PLT43995.1 Two-component response regulator yesN [Paenibacillus pasadenensis]